MPGNNNIIVVDDDVAMSRALERLLSLAGFAAATFLSAEALLQAGSAPEAACLVLDVNLPGLSGFELHRRLVQSGLRQPVIFITAHDDLESRTRARSAGATAYLTKPFDGQKLLAAITQVLTPSPPRPTFPQRA